MTEREPATVVADPELVADLRAGDRRAMAELYARHNADAVRVGRIVHPDGDPEELVAEAFARVFTKVVDGGGPTDNFRAYLHTVIRNLKIERIRQMGREQPASDKPWLLDTATDDYAAEVDDVDADHAARALRSLPENWQQLLFKLEVQGRKPAEVAAELSVPVATISDTAYRAREGLRLAYLNQHLPSTDNSRCHWTRDRLSRLARSGLSPRASTKARHHLNGCADCAGWYDELHQLNTKLGAAIWPIVLVGGITFGDIAGPGPTETSEPSDASNPSRSSTTSGGVGTSRLHSFAITPLTVIVAIVATALVAGVAVAGLRLLQADAHTPRSEGPALQDSAPSQVPPPPSSDDSSPEVVDDPSPVVNIAVTLPSPVATPPAISVPKQPVAVVEQTSQVPSPKPEPSPEPPEEPPAEPVPVDLKVGAPAIDPAVDPVQWQVTIPILSTEGAAATSFTIGLELSLSESAGFIERQPADWDCGPIQDGDSDGNPYFFDTVTCQYTYEPGQTVAPLRLILESASAPTGAVTVTGEGNADPDTSDNYRTF